MTTSYREVVPAGVLARHEFYEVRNAAAIMAATNPRRFADFVAVLDEFVLKTTDLTRPGGQESALAARLNRSFRARGWREARVDTIIELRLEVIRFEQETPALVKKSRVTNEGYKVDNFVDRVAGDVEWNAKDGNLDRDLGAYRFLYDAALIDVGVMVTRTQSDLRALGARLGQEAGLSREAARRILGTTTTTNMAKLLPRLQRGDAGGCPVLVAAFCARTWEHADAPEDVSPVATASADAAASDACAAGAAAVRTGASAGEGVPHELLTHCGVNEAAFGGRWFVRVGGPLDDGHGNAPSGWAQPIQPGRLAVTGAVAVFTDAAGHRETFVEREGAGGPLVGCASVSPLVSPR